MKKIFALASVAAMTMASCTQQTTGYTIKGTVSDSTMNGKTVYFVNINEKNPKPFDSTVVANNAFTFTTNDTLAVPQVINMSIGRSRANIFVDNGVEANVTIKSGELTVCSDNGGVNDAWTAFQQSSSEMGNKMQETRKKLVEAGVSQDSLRNTLVAMNQEIMDFYKKTMIENKDNMMGAYIFIITTNPSTFDGLAELDSATAEIKYANEYIQVQELRAGIEAKEATKAGKMFVDFEGKNIDGTPAKLSDFVGKGKYVLADFWASWCGPCRGEIPNLVELEKKFGGDKFMVLGINVWDQEGEFKKALENEGINYAQLYASENKECTKLYGINGIPQIILFAPDGTIVKRDLRGEEMKAFVAEQLAK